jgi:subtilisin-like proprotein convertase family protein
VTYPNEADKAQEPAGHSFVLVGWDDELEVQARDGEGKPVTDANGPVMEKGFFLFRNSWGTSSFGSQNPYGGGYGWISMAYVEEYLTAYVSGLPEIDFAEVCGDELDNDFDDQVDCDDPDCGSDGACVGGATGIHTFDGPAAIPDNSDAGVLTEIDVQQDGTIQSLAVTVDITHTYRGDLEVALVRDGDVVVLHNQAGGSQDDLKQTFVIPDFVGLDAAATYGLLVIDHAAQDTGVVNQWSVEITTGGESNVDVFESNERVTIPDNDPVGAFSNLDVTGPGQIASLKAVVNIDHDYKGDLTVRLQRLGQPGEVTLVQADASSGPFGTQSFVIGDFIGEDAAGTWRLVMIDEAASDVGTLLGWSLEVGR